MIATVTLNPAMDYTAAINSPLCKGAVNRTAAARMTAGGKGINVSYILHQLGEDTRIYGFAAGAVGAMLRQEISQWGIEADWIELHGQNNRINLKIEEHGIVTELNGSGVSISADTICQLVEKLSLFGDSDLIVLAGSLPSGAPVTLYADLMAKLRSRGVRFAVDAAGEALHAVLGCQPFLIKPNLPELCELFRADISSVEAAIPYGIRLQEMGARNVLLSMGEEGAVLFSEADGMFRLDAPHAKVCNTVGAGDSMLGGFLSGIVRGLSPAECLRLAVASGSATAFAPWLADRDAIQALLETLPEPKRLER